MTTPKELINYFSKRYSGNLEDAREALDLEGGLEVRLQAISTSSVMNYGTHPDGYEMCLWDGRLTSTRRGQYGVCEHCKSHRMLYLAPLPDSYYWHGWCCLECKKEVQAVDAKDHLPGPHLD